MDAVCGDTRRGDGPSIPPSATVLAAVTVAAASSEANNTRPPSSVGVDVTATAVTTAADVADDARYDHAVNVNGGPSPGWRRWWRGGGTALAAAAAWRWRWKLGGSVAGREAAE
jgi:hypothetical protein